MITLSARINIAANNAGEITGTSNVYDIKNNISAQLENVLEKKHSIRNPFLFGINVLGDGSTYSDGENYFISSQKTDENGKFATPIEFYIYGNNIRVFNIAFDDKNNVFPTSVYVDGTSHENADPTFTVFVSEQNSHLIRIEGLNTPNRPLIISGIFVNLVIDVTLRNMRNIERNIIDRADFELPSWGVVSNSANIDFIDTTGEVEEYIEQNLLASGSKVDIFLNNTLANITKTVGTFYSEKWNYDNDNKVVSVTLKDDLEEWQDILVGRYDVRLNVTMYDIYEYLVLTTPAKWDFEIEQETINFLKSITCEYAYLESGTLWSQWDKLCQIAMLHIYKNNENKVFVKHFI